MSATVVPQTAANWTQPASASYEFTAVDSPFIDQVVGSDSLVGRSGRSHPLDVFIPPTQGNLLYSLVRYLRPLRTLEVGMANGISTLYIAQALQDLGHGSHLAIDPCQHSDWDDVGILTLQRGGLDALVTLDPRPSHWALPDLDQAGTRIQFAFIDGCHLMDYVMTDFLVIDRILDVGGLIAFDDSDWPAVNQVIRFVLANRDYGVFPTGVVIEPSPGKPRVAARCLRSMVRRWQPLRRIIRNEFTYPSRDLDIDGRCVVLRKNSDDQRHALRKHLVDF